MAKRPVDVLVLSDLHLGSYGCNADELDAYLKSVEPKTLILNGDIVDMWQFKKYYFPAAHLRVLKRILNMATKGTTVYYLTGNHDENLRRFSDLHAGSLHLVDKLLLNIDGKQVWFFHGDVFDVTMRYSKWVAKLGGAGYNSLILLNRAINLISASLGYGKISLSKKIKDSVKSAIRFVDDFEQTAIDLALENGYDYVVCGHIHRPALRNVATENGEVIYMNSGDWIENLTSLEYHDGSWRLFRFEQDFIPEPPEKAEQEAAETFEAELISKEIPKVDLSDMKLEDLFQPAQLSNS